MRSTKWVKLTPKISHFFGPGTRTIRPGSRLDMEMSWKKSKYLSRIFIFDSITMKIWDKIQFGSLMPGKSENF